jgi:hypothetical protein
VLKQTTRKDAPSEVQYFRALEQWSLGAQGVLLSEEEMNVKAFSYGASLADTYWYMSYPPKTTSETDNRVAREKWQKLLRPERMNTQSERIDELSNYLEPYVAVALKHSIKKWGIAGSLKVLGDKLTPKDEQEMMQALESQAFIWRDIILGLRRPVDYLNRRDKILVWLLHHGLFIILTALLVLLVIFILVLLAFIIFAVFLRFQKQLQLLLPQGPLDFKNLIAIFTIFGALVGSIWAAGSWVSARLSLMYMWLDRQLNGFFIRRRTRRTWEVPGLK